MSLITMPKGDRFLAHSNEIVARHGVSLQLGYDFEEYRNLLKLHRPEQSVGAPFDPDLVDLTATNSFWIVGWLDGKIIHTQALRVIENGYRSLADYLEKGFRDYPPTGADIDFPRSRYRAGPGARRMSGKIVYHGEFWIAQGEMALRGSGLSCVLGRYGFWQAMQHWDPDHIFAFMAKAVAYKGLAERAGWMHTEPGALRWFIKGREDPIEGFLAYMDREDLSYLLELPLNDLVGRLAA